MNIIKLSQQNIEEQHICCAFTDKKCAEGYQAKKDWLKTEFKNGYTFRKLDERGKVFIEYVPIEHSWLPLEGKNFMVINCFWVSGKFKKHGYGKELLRQCKEDAKATGMNGIIAVSSDKKRPFMSDPKFFKKQGFEMVDQAPPFFKLYGLKFSETGDWPQFLDTARAGRCPDNGGITAYYSNTCPFTEYWTNQRLRDYAAEKGVPVEIHHLKNREESRRMPIPWVINSLFYKGELATLELKGDRYLDKMIGS